MNCKPGILAVFVRPWCIDEDIGRPVHVIRQAIPGERMEMRGGGFSNASGRPTRGSWLVEANGDGFPCFVADECLRPFNDPGDDAIDEVIQRIGTPNKEIA